MKINTWEVKGSVPSAKHVSGVWEKTNDENGHPFLAYHKTPTGSSCSQHKTREEAEQSLERTREIHKKFWEEKVQWAENNDVVLGEKLQRLALRVDGRHYVVTGVPDDYSETRGSGYGYSGHTFYWQWTDHSQQLIDGKVWRCNNVWSQGEIPPEFLDRLPDNAIWATHEEWEAQNNQKEQS